MITEYLFILKYTHHNLVLFTTLLIILNNVEFAQSSSSNIHPLYIATIKHIQENIYHLDSKINSYENEIAKCDKTITNSEKIIKLAREKGSIDAERIANDALIKSRNAKDKNIKLLSSANNLKRQSQIILSSIKKDLSANSNQNKNKALALNFSGDISVQKNNGEKFQLSDSKLSILETGDIIATGNDSKIELQFLEGRGNLLIGQNSKLKLSKGDSTDVIDFINGNMKIAVEKKDGFEKRIKEMYDELKQDIGSLPEDYEQFVKKMRAKMQKKLEVRNRGGGGGAVRGTDLIVNGSEDEGTEIFVLEGSVEMFSKDRLKIITVNAGQKGSLNSKGELTGPVNFDLKQIEKWWEDYE